MVKVELTAVVPLGVRVAGEAEQVVRVGKPLQVSATAALNPDTGLTPTLTFVPFPATTVAEVGLMDMPKSAPPPVREITCGLLFALSTKVIVPSALPAVVGV
jgi:hypothetical protein